LLRKVPLLMPLRRTLTASYSSLSPHRTTIRFFICAGVGSKVSFAQKPHRLLRSASPTIYVTSPIFAYECSIINFSVFLGCHLGDPVSLIQLLRISLTVLHCEVSCLAYCQNISRGSRIGFKFAALKSSNRLHCASSGLSHQLPERQSHMRVKLSG
jgi:hypothetical protein